MNVNKSVVTTSLSVLAMLVAIPAAQASEQNGQWYGYGVITSFHPDSDRLLEDEVAGGRIGMGRAFTKYLNGELQLGYIDVSGEIGGLDAKLTDAAVNGLLVFRRDKQFSPYILAGIGAVKTDPDGLASTTDLQLQAGPGFLVDLGTKRLALRAEVLGRWADSDPKLIDVLVNVGLQFSFGKERTTPVVTAVPAVVAAAPPGDSDNDGVTDDLDLCPGTPADVIVDSTGCGFDSDGDGFLNGIDQCPNSIQGALIDDVGCGYQLSGVQYAFDSDELNADAEALLSEVSDRLKTNSDVDIIIEGYTDSRGHETYNLGLSTRRALSAKNYLVDSGVAENRIKVIGLGEENPVASNDTAEGRAENRRVVLKIDK